AAEVTVLHGVGPPHSFDLLPLPALAGRGVGEGPLSEQRLSRDLYPLTRRAKGASTSPRKRGEVRNLTLTLQYLEHTARHRDTAFVDRHLRGDENQAAGRAH